MEEKRKGEEEWAKKESRMKGDQRMPTGKGGPRREEIHTSNLERLLWKRVQKWKNKAERGKLREDNQLSWN